MTELVLHLGHCEIIEAILPLIFWNFVKLGKSLLVLIFSMHDVGGLDLAAFFSRLVRVKESECLVEFTFLDQAD